MDYFSLADFSKINENSHYFYYEDSCKKDETKILNLNWRRRRCGDISFTAKYQRKRIGLTREERLWNRNDDDSEISEKWIGVNIFIRDSIN